MIMLTTVILWVLVLGQGAIAIVLLYQLADMKQRLANGEGVRFANGLPVRSTAPRFGATDVRSGATISSEDFDGRQVLLLFVSIGCSVCRRLVSRLVDVSPHHQLDHLVIVCEGSERGCRSYTQSVPGNVRVLLDSKSSVAELFSLYDGFPTTVTIKKDGRIAEIAHPTAVSDIVRWLGKDVGPEQEAGSSGSAAPLISG